MLREVHHAENTRQVWGSCVVVLVLLFVLVFVLVLVLLFVC